MTEIFTPAIIVAVVVALAIGAGIGVGLLLLMQRSQSGGKSLTAMREEQQAYRDEVDAHFEQTAQLFKEMTENYRQLYAHMASGAQKLCQGEPVIQPLDLPRPQALAAQKDPDTATAQETAATGDAGGEPAQNAAAEAAQQPARPRAED